VQYWTLFERSGGFVGGGGFVGCCGLRPRVYTPGEANVEMGFHIVKRCWCQGFATEAARARSIGAGRHLRLAKIYAGHHPDNHISKRVLERLGFTFLDTVFYEPTGLLHPSYVRHRPPAIRSE
jgi:[ribosomal protein S5]-alanine N-acetyltransferase